MGMQVIYYDLEPKLPMGNAKQLPSLKEVMEQSDVISLHVPASPDTVNLINAENLVYAKEEAILINASRGNVIDIDALSDALKAERLAGAAIDVFPKEPASKEEKFVSPLQGLNNVILTPHIGGSTTEAQVNIGKEVSYKLVQYSDEGSTQGSVNFPALSLPRQGSDRHRLLHIHKNIPGILGHINQILAESQTNILGQYLQTLPDVGYVVIEVGDEQSPILAQKLSKIEGTIRCRTLF
jgi:D-3-phosphoglycerate dehydrogenase